MHIGPEVYLAARYGRREEMLTRAAHLRLRGFRICARWIDGPGQILPALGRKLGPIDERLVEEGDPTNARTQRLCRAIAGMALADVKAASIVVAFTESPEGAPGSGRGGRHVELGLAYALRKEIHIVGPRENLFCWLDGVSVHQTWDDAVIALGDPVRKEPPPCLN